jgi:hypothetical protein
MSGHPSGVQMSVLGGVERWKSEQTWWSCMWFSQLSLWICVFGDEMNHGYRGVCNSSFQIRVSWDRNSGQLCACYFSLYKGYGASTSSSWESGFAAWLVLHQPWWLDCGGVALLGLALSRLKSGTFIRDFFHWKKHIIMYPFFGAHDYMFLLQIQSIYARHFCEEVAWKTAILQGFDAWSSKFLSCSWLYSCLMSISKWWM